LEQGTSTRAKDEIIEMNTTLRGFYDIGVERGLTIWPLPLEVKAVELSKHIELTDLYKVLFKCKFACFMGYRAGIMSGGFRMRNEPKK
jgi:hypothetical protein